MCRTHDTGCPGVPPVAAPLLLRLLVSIGGGAVAHHKLCQMVHLWPTWTKLEMMFVSKHNHHDAPHAELI